LLLTEVTKGNPAPPLGAVVVVVEVLEVVVEVLEVVVGPRGVVEPVVVEPVVVELVPGTVVVGTVVVVEVVGGFGRCLPGGAGGCRSDMAPMIGDSSAAPPTEPWVVASPNE